MSGPATKEKNVTELVPELPWGVTPAQYDYLTKGIVASRVRALSGKSHLEAWDVRRTLVRVFGFGGFDIETRNLELMREIEIPPRDEGGKSRWTVVYRADVRLTIKDGAGRPICSFDDSAAGDSANQPSLGDAHDHAAKTALSQALKRCAVNLGDQFGMSLYNKRNESDESGWAPVVVGSLVRPGMDVAPALDPDDAPAVVGGEMDDTPPPDYEDSQVPRPQPVSVGTQAPRPAAPRPLTAEERTQTLGLIGLAADAAALSRNEVAAMWTKDHDGQPITEATDRAGLESLLKTLRGQAKGVGQ